MRLLFILLITAFAVQKGFYYFLKQHHEYNSRRMREMKAKLETPLVAPAELEALILEEEQQELQIEQEIWNCVTLRLGGNISPSLAYKHEYWRLIACFFLHENFFHLLFNLLIINCYLSSLQLKGTELAPFFLLTVVGGNLTSALMYPEFLKIGSSVLTFVLTTLSVTENWRKWRIEKVIDLGMMVFLVFSFQNPRLDNALHYFGIASTLLFVYCRRKNRVWLFYCLIGAYLFFALLLMKAKGVTEEERFAVDLNYGCSGIWNPSTNEIR